MVPAIGYALQRPDRQLPGDPAVTAAEIPFDGRPESPCNGWPGEAKPAYVSVHCQCFSLPGSEPLPLERLRALREVAAAFGSTAVSEHLGVPNGQQGAPNGTRYLAPVYTAATLDDTCRNIERLQRYLGGPAFFLENVAYPERRGGAMTESEFLIRTFERTGCGWLLDVTNVYANAINHGYDAYTFIREVLPAASRLQIHLAGGYFERKSQMYVDSDAHAIPGPVWELFRFALEQGHGRVEAVFIERDPASPGWHNCRPEIRQARLLTETVSAAV